MGVKMRLVERLRTITLNDQRPLRNRSSFAALRGTYEDFIRCLNDLIFFWPGTVHTPKPKGSLAATFADRYSGFACLRIPTVDVWPAANATAIRFCTCNSGAPQARDRIEWGPHIFMACDDASLSFPKVAEVVYAHRRALPASTELRGTTDCAWKPLFSSMSSPATV